MSKFPGMPDFTWSKTEVERKCNCIENIRLSNTIGPNDSRELCEWANDVRTLRPGLAWLTCVSTERFEVVDFKGNEFNLEIVDFVNFGGQS